MNSGPLSGVRVIELAGVGPTPFCGMLLADMGASVIRVDRPESVRSGSVVQEAMARGKKAIGVDLKRDSGQQLILDLVKQADVLIEGLRPGATEKMGLGPSECMSVNEGLIYTRITGWGQSGPMAASAGHDINYIALSGALHAIGYEDRPPVPPLTLVGDFASGGLLAAYGVTAALVERASSGRGQIIDSAMFDGALLLLTSNFERLAAGAWSDMRASNSSDGGYPWYSAYATSDGKYVAVGCLEDKFFQQFCAISELDPDSFSERSDHQNWVGHREKLTAVFAARTRDEWTKLFDGTDACVVPVLSLGEVQGHEHALARSSFANVGGLRLPSAAPRLSRTPGTASPAYPRPGADGATALEGYGFTQQQVSHLIQEGSLVLPEPLNDLELTPSAQKLR